MPENPHPHRLVDVDGKAWDWIQENQYVPYNDRGAAPKTVAQINLTRGPTRYVGALPEGDRTALTAVLTRLADRAPHLLISTVCAAIYDANRQAGPRNPLQAGRPGSWESTTLTAIAYSVGRPILEDKDSFDQETMVAVADTIVSWVTGDPYIEVAENLASVLGPVIDHCGGWHNTITPEFHRDPHSGAVREWATSHSADASF